VLEPYKQIARGVSTNINKERSK